jgi:hypothetical protein
VTDPAYDSAHQAIRRALLAGASPADPCARCGRPLGPDPANVHLGHDDDHPGAYSGLEHKRCNESAGGRKGNERKRERRRDISSRAGLVAEVAVAVEINPERDHTSIVSAGYLTGDLIVLELQYLEGTDPLATILGLRERLEVLAVVIDPHSPGATAIRPLEAARLSVVRPTSADLAVATGSFVDLLRAGRIRHQRQPTLTSALQHLQARRLGGATGPERRSGAAVDVAPAVAAMLAVWALEALPAPPDPFALVGD